MIYVLETIDKVLAYNVRKLRGKRSQAEVAEAAGLPLRTYQRYENGVLPRRRRHLVALAKAFGVSETVLFIDPDLTRPTPQQAIDVLTELVKKNLPNALNLK